MSKEKGDEDVRTPNAKVYFKSVDNLNADICRAIAREIDDDEAFWDQCHFDVVKHAWGSHNYVERIMHVGCLRTRAEETFAITPMVLGAVQRQGDARPKVIKRAPTKIYALIKCIIEKNLVHLKRIIPTPLHSGMWTQVSIQKHWGDGTSDKQDTDHMHLDYGTYVKLVNLLYYLFTNSWQC